MGLDTVELVMEIEEAFDISIPEDRASRMLTVGDVYDFIIEKTAESTPTSSTCLTAMAFYELRRQLRSLGLAESGFRPKTRLDQVIPLAGRLSYWRALSSKMDLRFPRLARPSWLTLLNCMLVAILVSASFLVSARPYLATGIVVSLVVGIASGAVLLFLTNPFAVYPPPTCTTIRDLVTNLVALNYNKLASRYASRNPTDIWNALQLIVAEQLGIGRSAVVPGARFVQDLGAD